MSSDQLERVQSLLAAGELERAVELAQTIASSSPEHAETWNTLGTAFARAGMRDAASEAYRRAIALAPADHRPLANLAVVLRGAGQLEAARELLERARALAPRSAKVLTNLGNVLFALGRHAEAMASYRESVDLEPSLAAHRSLGQLAQQHGQHELALRQLSLALQLAPGDLGLVADLATCAVHAGQLELARECVARVLPSLASLESALSVARFTASLGFFGECERAARLALELEASSGEAGLLLAHALGATARVVEAERVLAPIAASSEDERLSLELARLRRQLSDPQGAQAALLGWLARHPESVAARLMLADEAVRRGEHEQARLLARRAVELAPDDPSALGTLARIELRRGQGALGMRALERAVALSPRSVALHSNYLYALQFSEIPEPRRRFLEHLRFGAKFDHPEAIHRPPVDHAPERMLRVAYLSPDLRDHSVARFIEPILRFHDRSRFEVSCYSTCPSPDATTERLAELADAFHDVRGLSSFALAQRIADDRVDVLLELSGHTADHRLRVMSSRPAPLQLSYLGYPDTTGLGSIDLRITDPTADPPGASDELATERLLRLPSAAWTYAPGCDLALPAAPAPERPVLASFNNLRKLTPRMRRLWAAVLDARPDARLRLKGDLLSDAESVPAFLDECARDGLDPARLELLPWSASREEHLRCYEGVSVALDTFPYHGTTTTMDALWMGVPVIVLEGTTHVSRVGVSLLRALELDELVVSSPEDYVARTLALLDDRPRREAIRASLRERILRSVLGDGQRFTSELEAAIRDAWRERCAKHAAGVLPERSERIVSLPSGLELVCLDDARARERAAALDVADPDPLTLPAHALLAPGELLLDCAGDGFAHGLLALAAGRRVLHVADDTALARRATASALRSSLGGLELLVAPDPRAISSAIGQHRPRALRARADARGLELLEAAGPALAELGLLVQLEPTTPSALAACAQLLEAAGFSLARSSPGQLFLLGAESPEPNAPLCAIPVTRLEELRSAGLVAAGSTGAPLPPNAAAETEELLRRSGVVRGAADDRDARVLVDCAEALLTPPEDPRRGALMERLLARAPELAASHALSMSVAARAAVETGRFQRARALVSELERLSDVELGRGALCSVLPRYDDVTAETHLGWFRAQLAEAGIRLAARSVADLPDEALAWLDRFQALAVPSIGMDRRLGLLSAKLDAFDP